MVSAIIADDNKDYCIKLANELNVTKEIKVIEIISEGTKVLQEIKKLQPEILILDLKLPGKNGLQIIEELSKDSSITTKVIVISGSNDYMTKIISNKRVIGYCEKINGIKEISLRIQKKASEIGRKSINQLIMDYLLDLGFTTSNNGTFLMRDCIRFFLITGKDDCKVKELFRRVAELNKQQSYNVKNNIHTSTKVAWNIGNKNHIVEKLRLGETEEISPKRVITMAKYYIDVY